MLVSEFESESKPESAAESKFDFKPILEFGIGSEAECKYELD